GAFVFELHDTFGFPIEVTEEIARAHGVPVDREGFERAMEAQRTRARQASKFARGEGGAPRAPWTEVTEGPDSEFLGYQELRADSLSLRRWREHAEGALELVLDRTPCYAESGGQVADRGWIEAIGIRTELLHVFREGESIVHRVRLLEGERAALLSAGA